MEREDKAPMTDAPRLLFADGELLIAEKPVGVLSQGDDPDALPVRLSRAGMPVLPVHRLDRGTGGAIVYAKTKRAAAALSALVGQHESFQKEYLAMLCAPPEHCPAPGDSGTLTDLLYHDPRRNKSFVVSRERRGVRSASLSYRVLAAAPADEHTTLVLAAVRLHTGRTHQIRVQFSSRGLPLSGDARYGGRCDKAGAAVFGRDPALWSCRLSFTHPFTGQTVSVTSLPDLSAAPWRPFAETIMQNMDK